MPHLRRIALLVGCLSLVVSPHARASVFIIELTNGREMVTSRVWGEGDELKFDVSQGTAGVPKALVKRIRTNDRVRYDQVSRRALAPAAPNAQASTPEGRSAASGPPRELSHDAAHQHTHTKGDAKRPSEANKTYLAASGAKDPEAKHAALQEMRGYSKQFYALADEVKAQHGGTLPAWWHE